MATASDRARSFFRSQSERVRSLRRTSERSTTATERGVNVYDFEDGVKRSQVGQDDQRASLAEIRASRRALGRLSKPQIPAFIMGKVKDRGQARRRDQLIATDGRVNELTIEWLGLVAPPIARAFDRELVPIAERATERWPQRTGVAVRGLTLDFRRRGASMVAGRFATLTRYAFMTRTYHYEAGRRFGEAELRAELRGEPGEAQRYKVIRDEGGSIDYWQDRRDRMRRIYKVGASTYAHVTLRRRFNAWQRLAFKPWRRVASAMADDIAREWGSRG